MQSNKESEEPSEKLRQIAEAGRKLLARLAHMPKQEPRPKPEYIVTEEMRRRLDKAKEQIEKELKEIDEKVKTCKFENKKERDEYVAKLLGINLPIDGRSSEKWIVYLKYSAKPFQE